MHMHGAYKYFWHYGENECRICPKSKVEISNQNEETDNRTKCTCNLLYTAGRLLVKTAGEKPASTPILILNHSVISKFKLNPLLETRKKRNS